MLSCTGPLALPGGRSVFKAGHICQRSGLALVARASRKQSQKQSRDQQQQQSSEPSTSAPAEQQQATAEIKREFTALGSKVVETNMPFKGPEDEKDFWEGDNFDAFGKALENYFLPGLIVLGLVCGGLAAKTYNDGATAFVKPPTGPDAEPSIIIAIPEAGQGAPSLSS